MKPFFNAGVASKNKYSQLLVVLVLNLVLSPFLRGNFGELLFSAMLAYTIILIVRTFSLNRRVFRFYVSFVVLVFILETIARFNWYRLESILFHVFLIQAVYAIYLGTAAGLVLRDILLHHKVTPDTIRGGICVYFLIGIVWALLYGIVASLDKGAFSQPFFGDLSYSNPVYFSFATLTTLGYGDIVPVSPIAKALTSLEAIVGQMYPSILIARLVSGYVSQHLK